MDMRSFGALFGPYLPSEHPSQALFDGVVESKLTGDVSDSGFQCGGA